MPYWFGWSAVTTHHSSKEESIKRHIKPKPKRQQETQAACTPRSNMGPRRTMASLSYSQSPFTSVQCSKDVLLCTCFNFLEVKLDPPVANILAFSLYLSLWAHLLPLFKLGFVRFKLSEELYYIIGFNYYRFWNEYYLNEDTDLRTVYGFREKGRRALRMF